MDDFLNAPFPAIRGQAPDLIPRIVDIPEEENVVQQDGRLMHLRGLGLPVERVFQPVLQNPGEYLMRRQVPFEELPRDWEEFSGNNYLGVQQHLQEESEAPEQIDDMDDEEEEFSENDDLGLQQHLQADLEAPVQEEDMDNEEEDLDDEEKTMDCTKPSSQDVDAKSSASRHVTKRNGSTTDDRRLMKEIGSSSSSSSSSPSFGLQDSAMPDASPAAFGSILEPVTTSETLTSDQVDDLGA